MSICPYSLGRPRAAGELRTFCEARDWDQFHGPKDLAIGLATEAGELLEIFRFLSDEQCDAKLADPESRQAIENELADALSSTTLSPQK